MLLFKRIGSAVAGAPLIAAATWQTWTIRSLPCLVELGENVLKLGQA